MRNKSLPLIKRKPSSAWRKAEGGRRRTVFSQLGQSLIEVIIASAVGILVVTALTFAVIFSLRNANFAKTSAQATQLAQEGIERVRTGRDRNECINNLSGVNSWNGSSSDTSCMGSGSIWTYSINTACSNPLNPNCYFNVTDKGVLNYLISESSVPDLADPIEPNFKRVVILSDDSTTYTTQKTVTVIVQWTDFAGPHQSILTTILRKL